MSMIPISNQRHIAACAAHAAADMLKYTWFKSTGEIIPFSARFIDILSWTPDLDFLKDGRYHSAILHVLTHVGCCTERLLPNDTTLPIEQYRNMTVITNEMFEEAAQYKILMPT